MATAAQYIPYVTDDDFVADSNGVNLSGMSATQRQGLLRRASLMVDRFCVNSFQCRAVVNETSDWGDSWTAEGRNVWKSEIFPYGAPVRTLTSLSVALGVSTDGSAASASIPISPFVVVDPSNPPPVSGQAWVDRGRGFIQPVFILLKFGLFAALPSLALTPPQVTMSYTCGFDPADGTAPVDVLTMPAPWELVEATRITACFLASNYNLNSGGFGAMEQGRVGDIQVRKRMGRSGTADATLPEDARDLLRALRSYSIAP